MKDYSAEQWNEWYLNAVKSYLILYRGLLPSDADSVISEYGLEKLLEKCPEAQMHDIPKDVVAEMEDMGLIHERYKRVFAIEQDINKASDTQLLKAAQQGVSDELERKKIEGKPISYWDKEKQQIYRLSTMGERIYVEDNCKVNNSDWYDIFPKGIGFVAKDKVTGIASQGETEEEALKNLIEGLELYYDMTNKPTDIPGGLRDPKIIKAYVESVMKTPGPPPNDEIPKVRIDYKGLLAYAEEKCVTPEELSFEETLPFLEELKEGELEKVKEVKKKIEQLIARRGK